MGVLFICPFIKLKLKILKLFFRTEESISTSEDDDWWNSSDGLHDPSKNDSDWDGTGGYDPNQQ